jgi:hypothetical protein
MTQEARPVGPRGPSTRASQRAEVMNDNLYATLLGSAWSTLPPVVRCLHQAGAARGQVTIEGGQNWPARILAQVLGFPSAAREVATQLVIERRGEEQVWSRRFGEHTMISRQRLRAGGLLAERFGAFECLFRLCPTSRGLDYDLVGVALAVAGRRMALPRFVALHGGARTWAEEDAMGIDVSISTPILGRLLRYHGLVRPESGEARP